MRKIRFLGLITLLVSSTFFFTGCFETSCTQMINDGIELLISLGDEDNKYISRSDKEEYLHPERHAIEVTEEIIECFRNRDKEKLRKFFNYYYRDRLYSDMEEAFNFIDGEIIAHSVIWGKSYESQGGDNLKLRYLSYAADTYIITDKGAEYHIFLGGKLIDNEDPKRVGVNALKILNENKVHGTPPYKWWEHWRDYKDIVFILGDPYYG